MNELLFYICNPLYTSGTIFLVIFCYFFWTDTTGKNLLYFVQKTRPFTHIFLRAVAFTLVAVGHPGVFTVNFLNPRALVHLGGNCIKVDLPFFIIFALITYSLGLIFQLGFINLFKPIDSWRFIDSKLFGASFIISLFGLAHLMAWVVPGGLEFNMFGFFFALPFFLLLCCSFVTFLANACQVINGQFDLKTNSKI